jgi:ribosomal protein S18 acetylase RimI-like enzyme
MDAPIRCRAYQPDHDFMRVRQFLIDTFALYQRPYNWLIDHWNFCRYFVTPVHTYYNVRHFDVPTRPHPFLWDEVARWEHLVSVWENSAGEVVAVVNTENEGPGEAWFQIHPAYTFLYDRLIDDVEERLADRAEGVAFLKLYVNHGSELETVAAARGYRKLPQPTTYLEYTLDPADPPAGLPLPAGFAIRSVAEVDDVEQRRRAKSIAFGGSFAPSDWPPAAAFRAMQQAPDYAADLDLFVLAPNGDCASFCTIWVDAANHYANFEPVGTRIDYQGMGLARALLHEGFRRMAARGVTRSFMASGNDFYRKVGFRDTSAGYSPWIKSWTA